MSIPFGSYFAKVSSSSSSANSVSSYQSSESSISSFGSNSSASMTPPKCHQCSSRLNIWETEVAKRAIMIDGFYFCDKSCYGEYQTEECDKNKDKTPTSRFDLMDI